MNLPKPMILACAATSLLAGILPAIRITAAPAAAPFQIVDQAGMPLRDAVIEIAPLAGDTRRPAFSWRNAMAQRNLAFLPGTLIVPKGATVAFPNLDTVRHSIYSFSKPGPFRIDLYSHEQTRSQRFDNAGTISLGCNIHDTMQGYVRVVSTPYAARTDGNGLALIDGVSGGARDIVVWHPRIRGTGGEWRGRVTLIPGQRNRLTVAVRPIAGK